MRKPLSTVVAESLSEKILSGDLPAGAQLPTEAELCTEYSVSRTVVREAVARLRSDGKVIPHQGRGVFVNAAPPPRSFTITQEALQTLPETIALLELRLSVEVEAAGLCAERRTNAEARAIRLLMEEVDAKHADPSTVEIHYDYDFHLAIAKATHNEFIHAFLNYLRPIIVPRFHLKYVVGAELQDVYYDRIHAEHRSIVEAITNKKVALARREMRRHLTNSLWRVGAFAKVSGVEVSSAEQERAAASLFATIKPGRK